MVWEFEQELGAELWLELRGGATYGWDRDGDPLPSRSRPGPPSRRYPRDPQFSAAFPRLPVPVTFPSRDLPGPSPATSPLRLDHSYLPCVLPFSPHVIRILHYPTPSFLTGRISLRTGSGLCLFCPPLHVTPSRFNFSRSPFDLIHSPFPDRVPTLAPSAAT